MHTCTSFSFWATTDKFKLVDTHFGLVGCGFLRSPWLTTVEKSQQNYMNLHEKLHESDVNGIVLTNYQGNAKEHFVTQINCSKCLKLQ